MDTTTDPMTTTDRSLERLDRFTRVVDGVDGRWDAPTPCTEWTVRDVVRHAIDSERDFLTRQHLLDGSTEDPGVDADPAAAWHRHRDLLVEVLAREGVPETEYDGYFGRTTIGDTIADLYAWDLAVHAWDVARATGQTYDLPDDEVERLDRTADGWGDALHSDGVAGPPVPVPDDAPALDRLLGRLGRDPGWTP